MLENTPENRSQALSLLRAGRLDPARAAYEALVATAPDDADLLGLLAAVTLQQGRLPEAEEMFGRSLAIGAEPRIHLRDLNNFGMLLRATGRGAQARELALAEAPEWPEEVPAEAVETLARAADLAPADHQAPIALSYALSRSGAGAAARATAHRIARTWPVYADPPGASQRAILLVFNRASTAIHDPDCDLHRLHFWGNYAAQVSRSMRGEYRLASLFADLPEDAMPERVPAADLVLNNIVNSEEIRDRLPLDMFGVDFDVDRDGRMVFFEAGAAMIFHTDFGNEPADLRPPKEPYIRIDDAFRDLVARRIAQGPRGPA